MTHSLLSSSEHLPLKSGANLELFELPGGNTLEQHLPKEEGLTRRSPLVLLGSDRSAALLRDAFRSLANWELPLLEGSLAGASSVWACEFSSGGTPAATLIEGGSASISLALVTQKQLAALQLASDPSYQLVELPDCLLEVESITISKPLCLAPWSGALSIDGEPRAVAINAVPGGPRAMLMIEVAEWVCNLAQANGLNLKTPQDLQRACADSQERARLISLMQPAIPSRLRLERL